MLPTRSSLARFAADLDTSCPLCGDQAETALHLFWFCPLARALSLTLFGVLGMMQLTLIIHYSLLNGL